MNILMASLFVIAFSLECADAVETPPSHAKPSDEAILSATRLVEDSYQRELAAAVTPASKRELAVKLLAGAKVELDVANKYALLQKSRSLAAAIGDVILVLENLQETGRSFNLKISTIHEEVVQELFQAAKTPFDHYLIARYLSRVTNHYEALDQLDVAKELAVHGLASATKSREADCVAQWKRRIEDIDRRIFAWRKVQTALATLEKEPTDPAANRIVGAYHCIYANDWESGLPMLALGDVTAWQKLAEKELQTSLSAEVHIELADGWYAVAKNADRSARIALLKWSARHIQIALPQLTGLTKRRVESKLSEIKREISPFSTGEWIEVLDFSGLTEKVDQGVWKEVGLSLVSGEGAEILTLPAPVDEPYELRIQVQDFRRELQLYLFPNPYSAQLVINGWKGEQTGLYGLNGSYEDRSAFVKGFTPLQGITTFDIRVNHQALRRSLNLRVYGRPYYSWTGPVDALKAPVVPASKFPEMRSNLILVTAGSPTNFVSVRLKQSKTKGE